VNTTTLDRERDTKALLADIFSRVLYKTNFSNKKSNQILLSIDLLKDNKKKHLLSIATRRLEKTYRVLLEKTKPEVTLKNSGKSLLIYNLTKICEEFLTLEYGYKIAIDDQQIKNSLYTKRLVRDIEILFRVPFYSIINPNSSNFKAIYSPIYNQASETLLEAFIDNLVIEISNCVTYFIITNFSSAYTLRQTLFRSKFLSLRNFERFRNNLRWQLNIKSYFTRPMDLYNSSFDLYLLGSSGIYYRTVFANRTAEIKSLQKISLLTILSLESRDFFVSRFDELIYLLSKSLRFTVSSIFGQFLGLVWRGIIEGLKK
jgi:hypothetical protein